MEQRSHRCDVSIRKQTSMVERFLVYYWSITSSDKPDTEIIHWLQATPPSVHLLLKKSRILDINYAIQATLPSLSAMSTLFPRASGLLLNRSNTRELYQLESCQTIQIQWIFPKMVLKNMVSTNIKENTIKTNLSGTNVMNFFFEKRFS